MALRFILMALTAAAAGLVQGVTGFGCCIVMMLVYPYFYGVAQAAGISIAAAVALNAAMAWHYRKELTVKKAVLPAILYIAVCTAAIHFGSKMDAALIKRILGGFLIVLSIYYLFFHKAAAGKPMSPPAAAGAIGISAVCDGLFGIGGPLMAVYYLGQTKTAHEFLGMIQFFFLITCVWNTGFRFATGVLTGAHLLPCVVCAAGILAGAFIANRIVDKVNADMLRKLTYVMIGISGVINLLGL